MLHNMSNPAVPPEWEETKTAARALGFQAELLDVRSQGDLARAFELAVRQHVDALVIGADGLIQTHQQTIVDLAARNRLPAVYPAREFVEAGGLAAYAVNYPDLYFQFGRLIDKSSRARSLAIFLWNSRPSSSWSSMQRPPIRSASVPLIAPRPR